MISDFQSPLDMIVDTEENDFHLHANLFSFIRKLFSLFCIVSFILLTP